MNIPYRNEKIDNAICFFASEYKYKTKKYLPSMFLYKFLAFLDFSSVKKYGRPSLGLNYLALKWGPVPVEIYNKRNDLKTDFYEFKPIDKEGKKYIIIPKSEPDLDYFSDQEITEMYNLIEIYADSYVKSSDISEASHQDIFAWKRTFRNNPNTVIDYLSHFPGDITKKDPGKITPQEENILCFTAGNKL
jgi:hypothetical protein